MTRGRIALLVLLLSGSAPLAAQPGSDAPVPAPAPPPKAANGSGKPTAVTPAPAPPPKAANGNGKPAAVTPAPAPEPAPPPKAANENGKPAVTPPPAAAAAPAAAPQPVAAADATLSPAERDRIRIELLRDARALREQRDAREAAAVRAERSPSDAIPSLTLAASLETLFYADAGYDLFDEDDDVSTRFGLWAAYDIARLSPRLTLAIELGGGGESHESFIWNGGIETQLEAITITAGATLRFAWLPFLDPQLRVSAGASRLSFELKTRDSGSFDDDAISGLGTLGIGLLFHTPPRVFENRFGQFASLSFGLLVEGGYALRSPVEPELEADSESNAIPLTRASLGELGLSGPYLRSSLLARF